MSAYHQTRNGIGRTVSRAGRSDALATAGRLGFTARGVVYVLVGVLALRIAVGHGGPHADRQGALQQVAAGPGGPLLLWLLVVGFAAMALWRAALAVFAEAGNRKAGKRALNAVRAAFYVSVCWGTAAFAAQGGGQRSSDSTSQDWTARALGLSGGRVIAGVAGLVVVGVGVAMVVRALQHRFLRKLETGRMRARTRRIVTAVGTAGNAARGVVLAAAGVFLVQAAIRFDPHQAKGLDSTLRSLARTPAGPWLLAAVAVGLALFGVFSFASARWRRLTPHS